jgi:hypothetical protein
MPATQLHVAGSSTSPLMAGLSKGRASSQVYNLEKRKKKKKETQGCISTSF